MQWKGGGGWRELYSAITLIVNAIDKNTSYTSPTDKAGSRNKREREKLRHGDVIRRCHEHNSDRGFGLTRFESGSYSSLEYESSPSRDRVDRTPLRREKTLSFVVSCGDCRRAAATRPPRDEIVLTTTFYTTVTCSPRNNIDNSVRE